MQLGNEERNIYGQPLEDQHPKEQSDDWLVAGAFLFERGEQIQAAFHKAAVDCVGCGILPAIGNDPEKVSLTFSYMELESALVEFPEVGLRLGFPPGTELITLDRVGWILMPQSALWQLGRKRAARRTKHVL